MINEISEDIKKKVGLLLDETILSNMEPLITSGRMGSLQTVELACWLEKTYGIDFAKHGFNVFDFETIETITVLVNEAMNKA